MRSLRNSIVMAVDELFVSQKVFPNSCFVAEAEPTFQGLPLDEELKRRVWGLTESNVRSSRNSAAALISTSRRRASRVAHSTKVKGRNAKRGRRGAIIVSTFLKVGQTR